MLWAWFLVGVALGGVLFLAMRASRRFPSRHRRFGASHTRQAVDHHFGRFGGSYQEDVERREGVTKVGRNDPCPCGSGNKFKKCCGAMP